MTGKNIGRVPMSKQEQMGASVLPMEWPQVEKEPYAYNNARESTNAEG